MYSCDICKKSFTRNTNLTKHKRTHSENTKSFKCSLCPKAFYSNSELSRHLEIHMDRKAMFCKYCNQAFTQRDKLDVHLKTHFDPTVKVEVPPQPIVFYNQQSAPAAPPMNFYTESIAYNMEQQMIQPKKEYPIMNQLLTGPNVAQMNPSLAVPPVKNFSCGICSSAFFKKRDLDRHVLTIHTNAKQYKCESCSKTFNRKDKLTRHEKIHLIPQNVYNCSLCPAVFIRQHLLENHSKVHQISNGDHNQLESFLASLQPIGDTNGQLSLMNVEASQQLMSAMVQSAVPNTPATLYPMNLSIDKSLNEPMNLSNNRTEVKVESNMKAEPASMIIDSDDEDVGLRIVEEAPNVKQSPRLYENAFAPEAHHPEHHQSDQQFQMTPQRSMLMEPMIISENSAPDMRPRFEEPIKSVDEISFAMTSRIADLEPLRDLPMEILNND